jgi:hypothetical protein
MGSRWLNGGGALPVWTGVRVTCYGAGMEKPIEIIDKVMTADGQLRLTPCIDYVATIADNAASSGAAKLQLWNGNAYLDSAASDGSTSQVFTFTSPPSGRVNVNLTAGQVKVSFKPKVLLTTPVG